MYNSHWDVLKRRKSRAIFFNGIFPKKVHGVLIVVKMPHEHDRDALDRTWYIKHWSSKVPSNFWGLMRLTCVVERDDWRQVMNDRRRMWRVPDLVTCLGPVSVLPRNINVYKKVGTETRSNGQTSIFPRHTGPFIFSSQSRGWPRIPRSDHSPLIDPHVVSAAAWPRGCLRGPDTELVDVSSLAALTLVTFTGAGSVHLTTWNVVSWGHMTLAPALMINMCSGLAATFVEEQI